MKANFILLFLCLILSGTSATASEQMSSELRTEITQDLQTNFAARLTSIAADTEDDESVLSAKDQKVMLKALYVGVSGPLALAGLHISETGFYSKVGKLLLKGAEYGVLPSAITVGFFKRADLLVGKTYATEMNFYLDQGTLKVSTYDLNTLQVGLSASAKIGYYVALCFGSCTGGDANGTYIGLDADLIYGVGANIYIEVGVDTTDYKKAKKSGESYTKADLYDCKAVYIGAGIDFGVGIGVSMGFTDYYMTSDNAIIDLYSIANQPYFGARVKSAFDRLDLFRTAPRL